MSRIALQIFLAFFLALVTIAGVAMATTAWTLSRQETLLQTEIREQASRAAEALANEGNSGLVNWAREQQANADDWLILVFDEWGEEILGRERPATLSVSRPVLSPWLDTPAITLDLGRDAPVLINEFDERFQLIPVRLPESQGHLAALGQPRTLVPVLLILIALPLSWALARFLTRPILDLQNTLQRLSEGHLEARVPARTARRRDELGQLARALDDMTTKLNELITSRERLLRDISHELRSPLTRIRLALALLEQTLDDPSPQSHDVNSRQSEIARIEREISKLDELIANVLDLARLNDLVDEHSCVDLFPWLDSTLQDACFEARQAGRNIRYHLPKELLLIRGSAEWSAAAFENVLRNAIRHTPPEGIIMVEADWQPDHIGISVFNEGSSVPEQHLSQIFEPFFRVDSDRDRRSGGTGLGLAIAARVMQAHGGSIAAHNLPPNADRPAGVKIELFWPRLAEPELQANA